MSLSKSAFRPRVEALEAREVPATFSVTGNTMIVTGTNAAEQIVVTDDGTGNVNNITVVVTTNGVPDAFSPGRSIWEVRVDAQGGNDKVTYNMTQPLQGSGWYHELEVELGEGADTYRGYIPGISSGAVGMNLYINGNNGNDNLQTNIYGRVSSNTLNGGVGMGMTGGLGADSVVLDYMRPDGTLADMDISAGALVWANMHGYEGWDAQLNAPDNGNTVGLWYRGELDGRLAFTMHGSGGSDYMFAYVDPESGSTGVVGDLTNSQGTRMLGGGSHDVMNFRIYRWNGNKVQTHQAGVVLDGGDGYDSGTYSKWNYFNPIAISNFEGLSNVDGIWP